LAPEDNLPFRIEYANFDEMLVDVKPHVTGHARCLRGRVRAREGRPRRRARRAERDLSLRARSPAGWAARWSLKKPGQCPLSIADQTREGDGLHDSRYGLGVPSHPRPPISGNFIRRRTGWGDKRGRSLAYQLKKRAFF